MVKFMESDYSHYFYQLNTYSTTFILVYFGIFNIFSFLTLDNKTNFGYFNVLMHLY